MEKVIYKNVTKTKVDLDDSSQTSNEKSIFSSQKKYFDSGKTLTLAFRLRQLKLLKRAVLQFENKIIEALEKDLGKNEVESYTTELYPLISELDYHIKHLSEWSCSISCEVPLIFKPAKAQYRHVPKGCVLVLGSFNYPFLLALRPVIGAISAGNCVVLKPSERSKYTSKIIFEMFEEFFPSNYLAVVCGGAQMGKDLTDLPFEHFFFTGSPVTGKKIYEKAAHHLSTVTLELGGKSPFVVWPSTNLENAAKKCVWGKFTNHGQTCVAPDYVLVHESLYDEFVVLLKKYIKKFFGEEPLKSKNYSSCIDNKTLKNLQSLLSGVHILEGGRVDVKTRRLEPTLVSDVPSDHQLLNQEIFGPILPIVSCKKLQDVFDLCRKNPNPLTSYLFTHDKQIHNFFENSFSCGSIVYHDTMLQLGLSSLPFGGVKTSGVGRYHGQKSFESFSNIKSIYHGSERVDHNLRYPPYKLSLKWLKRMLPFVG